MSVNRLVRPSRTTVRATRGPPAERLSSRRWPRRSDEEFETEYTRRGGSVVELRDGPRRERPSGRAGCADGQQPAAGEGHVDHRLAERSAIAGASGDADGVAAAQVAQERPERHG